MNIGKARKRVDIQALAETRDGDFGQPLKTWTTLLTVWAEVRPLQGREAANAQQIKAEMTHAIVMRYPGFTLNGSNRLLLGSRVFNVQDARNVDERGREYYILATEQTTPTS